MIICPAQNFDIDPIMKIERAAFIPAIQERQKTFEERLNVFPRGFIVLSDTDEKTVFENGKALTCGYFTSEIWSAFPVADKLFKLGHKIKKVHDDDGCILYVSSFALLPNYQGRGLGKFFFNKAFESVCGAYPKVRKSVLLVNEEWGGARHIYESAGFKEVRRIEGFFPSLRKSKSAGIVMEKKL